MSTMEHIQTDHFRVALTQVVGKAGHAAVLQETAADDGLPELEDAFAAVTQVGQHASGDCGTAVASCAVLCKQQPALLHPSRRCCTRPCHSGLGLGTPAVAIGQ